LNYTLHEASSIDEAGRGEKRRGFAPRPHLRGLPTEVGEKSPPLEEWERIPAKTLVKRLQYSFVQTYRINLSLGAIRKILALLPSCLSKRGGGHPAILTTSRSFSLSRWSRQNHDPQRPFLPCVSLLHPVQSPGKTVCFIKWFCNVFLIHRRIQSVPL